MVDAPDSNFDPPQAGSPMSDPKPGFAAFAASTTGKLVIGGAAVLVAIALVGGIVYAFLLAPTAGTTPDPNAVSITASGSKSAGASSAASAAAEAPIVDPLEKPLESDFTFRNVFAPTVKPEFQEVETSSTTGGSSSSSSSSSTVSVPSDTLFLSSIQTVNGHKTGTFIWNDKTYVLAAGDTITDTPWKVVEIGTTSVVMLFGDTEVTLTTGQGLSK